MSWSHKLFVQVLGKTLAEGERAGEGGREEGWGGGGDINSCTTSPKRANTASVVRPLEARAEQNGEADPLM